MKVRTGNVKPLKFTEDGCEMSVAYSNRGEPFRRGVEFAFDSNDVKTVPIWVLLDRDEVALLRDKLDEFLSAKD